MKRMLVAVALGCVALFGSGCSRTPTGPTTTVIYRANFEASAIQGLVPAALGHGEERKLLESTSRALLARLDPTGELGVGIEVDGDFLKVELPVSASVPAGLASPGVGPAPVPTGGFGFHIHASDATFQGASSIEQELQRARDWLEANPGLTLGSYNALAFEAGGPWASAVRAVRVYPVRPESAGGQGEADRLVVVELEESADWRFSRSDLMNVEATADSRGFPALSIELMPLRKAAFRAFTGAHLDESLAVVIDDEIVTSPRIMSPVPGSLFIQGGATGFTADEAERMIRVLRTGQLPLVLELVGK